MPLSCRAALAHLSLLHGRRDVSNYLVWFLFMLVTDDIVQQNLVYEVVNSYPETSRVGLGGLLVLQ
jgi:hypothetical protein